MDFYLVNCAHQSLLALDFRLGAAVNPTSADLITMDQLAVNLLQDQPSARQAGLPLQ
ncbi:hypothetical protein [Iodobacter ciconiae]|uniref:hypothetical protein n=1 Tax=Iodobacter ciconiae TaxID=2496266 RepID=UPI0013DFC69C|nr:hypothetical protein [Iodobacter ciconiae]